MIPKSILIVLVALFVLLAGVNSSGSMMIYAHEGDNSIVHTCINNSSGTIKVADVNELCKENEISIHLVPVGLDGNVGIGTSIPTEALDVVGNVHVSGEFIAGSTTRYRDGLITMSVGTNLDIDAGTLFIDNANN